MNFTVIDIQTGCYPDIDSILEFEDWAKNICYCDIEGFLLNEYGQLLLADQCGNYVFCPSGRFKVRVEIPEHEDYEYVYWFLED